MAARVRTWDVCTGGSEVSGRVGTDTDTDGTYEVTVGTEGAADSPEAAPDAALVPAPAAPLAWGTGSGVGPDGTEVGEGSGLGVCEPE